MKKVLWLMLALGMTVTASGCGGRQIFYVRGCDERLAIPEKRMDCRACVERPIPHEYLPDNPYGQRCVRR